MKLVGFLAQSSFALTHNGHYNLFLYNMENTSGQYFFFSDMDGDDFDTDEVIDTIEMQRAIELSLSSKKDK